MKPLILLLSIFILGACNIDSIKGSSKMSSKSYELKDFNSIDISSTFELDLIQSKDFKIVVHCNDNLKEYVDVYLKEDCLYVGLEGSHSFSNIELKVTVHAPNINRIEASGASSIVIEDYKIDNFEFDLSGASNVDAKIITSEKLRIGASGASDIKLRGKANNAELDFSGASEFSGKKLIVSDKLIIDSSGASSITVTANGTLEIDASGASSIKYYGKGKIIRENISGAGSVKHK